MLCGIVASVWAQQARQRLADVIVDTDSNNGELLTAVAVEVSGPRELFDRTTVSGIYDNSTGPVYPVFVEDLPIPDEQLFATATPVPHPNEAEPAPAKVPATCDLSQQALCKPTWQQCILKNASSHEVSIGCNTQRQTHCNGHRNVPHIGSQVSIVILVHVAHLQVVCRCYQDLAFCHRWSKCFDLLSRDEIYWCYNNVRCTLNQCEGYEAGTVAVTSDATSSLAPRVPWAVTVLLLVLPLLACFATSTTVGVGLLVER